MVKLAEMLKESDSDLRFEARLRELLGRVPFLKIKSFRREAVSFGVRVDWLLEVDAHGKPWVLVVEEKRNGQPREVREGLLQLEHYLRRAEGRSCAGIIVAPFISEESAGLCAEAGISYADLAGNARLVFDGVYIETRGAENPFREKKEVRSLFAPRAARVLRVLLQGPLRAWKVVELAERSAVSLGWVSAVRQQLLAREWAVEERGGLRVTKPDSVLEAWARADDWARRTEIHEYSVLTSEPERLAEKLAEEVEGVAFTQWFAGWLRHPYTIPPVVTAYVKRLPEVAVIERKFLARRVDGGGGLRLVLPKDEGVFHPAQQVRGFNLVSDVQIYLDLLRAGQRGDEQAAELRKWPDFAGGWA